MSSTTYYAYDKSHRMTKSYPAGATGESRYFTYNERNMVTQIQDVNTAGGADSNRYFTYNGLGERVVVVDGAGPIYWAYDKKKIVSENWVIGGATYYTFYRNNDFIGGTSLATNDPCPPPCNEMIDVFPGHPAERFYPAFDHRGSAGKIENYTSDGTQSINTKLYDVFGNVLSSATQLAFAERLGFLSGRGLLSLTTTQPLMAANNGQVYNPQLALTTVGAGGLKLLRATSAGLGTNDDEGGGILLQQDPTPTPQPPQGGGGDDGGDALATCTKCNATSAINFFDAGLVAMPAYVTSIDEDVRKTLVDNPTWTPEHMQAFRGTNELRKKRGLQQLGSRQFVYTFQVSGTLQDPSNWRKCTYQQWVKSKETLGGSKTHAGGGAGVGDWGAESSLFGDTHPAEAAGRLNPSGIDKDPKKQDSENFVLDAEFWPSGYANPAVTQKLFFRAGNLSYSWIDPVGFSPTAAGDFRELHFKAKIIGTDETWIKKYGFKLSFDGTNGAPTMLENEEPRKER